jgi:hypothetical protein
MQWPLLSFQQLGRSFCLDVTQTPLAIVNLHAMKTIVCIAIGIKLHFRTWVDTKDTLFSGAEVKFNSTGRFDTLVSGLSKKVVIQRLKVEGAKTNTPSKTNTYELLPIANTLLS